MLLFIIIVLHRTYPPTSNDHATTQRNARRTRQFRPVYMAHLETQQSRMDLLVNHVVKNPIL